MHFLDSHILHADASSEFSSECYKSSLKMKLQSVLSNWPHVSWPVIITRDLREACSFCGVTRSCFTTFQLCKWLHTCYSDSYTKSIIIKVHCCGCCLWHLNNLFLFPWFIREQNAEENKPLDRQKIAFLILHLEFDCRKFYQPVFASDTVTIPKIIHQLEIWWVNILWFSKLQFQWVLAVPHIFSPK